jgi:hypothetical protein
MELHAPPTAMAEVALSIFAGGGGRRYELRGRRPGVISAWLPPDAIARPDEHRHASERCRDKRPAECLRKPCRTVD